MLSRLEAVRQENIRTQDNTQETVGKEQGKTKGTIITN